MMTTMFSERAGSSSVATQLSAPSLAGIVNAAGSFRSTSQDENRELL